MASGLATAAAVDDVRKKVETVEKEFVTVKTDVAVLKWMVGFGIAPSLAILTLLLRGLIAH